MQPQETPPQTSRRSFYVVAIQGLGAIIGATLAIPAVAYLFASPSSKRRSQWVQAADVSGLQPGKPKEVTYRRTRIDGWRVVNEKTTAWVVKMPDNSIVAYSPSCTHLGCAYHWDAQNMNFLCPCHTSVFSIDGKVLAGPAPRPLDRYETRVESGKLLISPEITKSV